MEYDVSNEIFKSKYQYKDETIEGMWRRIAKSLASVEQNKEQYEEQFYEALKDFKFIPGGRIIANAGTERANATSGNCYVMRNVPDSMSGIFDVLRETALTLQSGGGAGIYLGEIRPNGALVRGCDAKASGGVSFAHVFDASCRTIASAGNRRGAMLMCLPVWHPDIEEFILAKRGNNALQMANLSVGITDAFMRAVESGTDWNLIFDGKVYKTVKARDLWETIMRSTYNYAEPGVLFIDRINTMNNLKEIEKIYTSNPCLVGDTLLVTRQGMRSIEELAEKLPDGRPQVFEVWDGSKWVASTAFLTGGKRVIELTLSNGQKFKTTPDHRLGLLDGTEVDALYSLDCALDFMRPVVEDTIEDPMYVMAGFIQGDGSYHKASNRWKYVSIGENDSDVYAYFEKNQCLLEAPSPSKPWMYGLKKGAMPILDDLLLPRKRKERGLTYMAKTLPRSYAASFLKGLYSANGSNVGCRVTLKSSCREEIDDVQEMLTLFGIRSYTTTNKSKEVEFDNGTYTCAESYDLNIAGLEDIERFHRYIGFIHTYKTKALEASISVYKGKEGNRKSITVVKIEEAGEEFVYDFAMEETHWASVSGFRMHNCGEQVLPAGGCCLLGSINLAQFVCKPFQVDAFFDDYTFQNTVGTAVRMLDNTLDLSHYPLPMQKEEATSKRRIGLGITGLADMLAMLRLVYGSKESIEVIGSIMNGFTNFAYTTSARLAYEKGAFPLYKKEKYLESNFIKTLNASTKSHISEYGMRNSHLTTVAPTGTTSMLAGNISSGLEPIFALRYDRRIRTGQEGEEITVEMEDYAVKQYRELTGERDLPEYFVTSDQVPPEQHIAVQAVIQKYIDSSTSKTINVPTDFPYEKFKDIYSLAYSSGLKGITTFRPNEHIMGVLQKKEDKKPEAPKQEFVKPMHMPEIMSALRIKQMTPFGQMHVKIVIDPVTGREREVFATLGKGGDVAGSDLEAICRLVSMYLRVNGSIKDVVRQLDGIGSNLSIPTKDGRIASLADAIAKAIKKYQLLRKKCGLEAILLGTADYSLLKKGLKGTEKDKPEAYAIVCPECGSALSKSEGCVKCPSCGYSKC